MCQCNSDQTFLATMSAFATFDEQYNKIENELKLNPIWIRREQFELDWFPNALNGKQAVKLAPGEMAKLKLPPEVDNIRMIFIGTSLGPLVIYERDHVANWSPMRYITSERATELRRTFDLGFDAKMSADQLNQAFGTADGPNIGHVIEQALKVKT